VVAKLRWPSICCTRWDGAPRPDAGACLSLCGETSSLLRTGASPDVAPELTAGERAVCLLRAEYGVARRTESFEGFRVAKRNEDMPGGGRKEHRAHLLALAVARDLAGGVSFEGAALLKAAPVEAGDFRDVGAADEEAALALTRSSCAYCQPRRGPL